MAATDTGERTVAHGVDQAGTTAQRPANAPLGHIYYDVTLSKCIVWDGAAWTNVDGTSLS